MHHEVDTFERMEIIKDLRLGTIDVVVGINLLREGLDLPEVSLVACLLYTSKLLDEGALARAHRPHHANEDVAAGAGSYLAADCRLLDSFLFCQNALPSLPI